MTMLYRVTIFLFLYMIRVHTYALLNLTTYFTSSGAADFWSTIVEANAPTRAGTVLYLF